MLNGELPRFEADRGHMTLTSRHQGGVSITWPLPRRTRHPPRSTDAARRASLPGSPAAESVTPGTRGSGPRAGSRRQSERLRHRRACPRHEGLRPGRRPGLRGRRAHEARGATRPEHRSAANSGHLHVRTSAGDLVTPASGIMRVILLTRAGSERAPTASLRAGSVGSWPGTPVGSHDPPDLTRAGTAHPEKAVARTGESPVRSMPMSCDITLSG
jgi:hypothetical protein